MNAPLGRRPCASSASTVTPLLSSSSTKRSANLSLRDMSSGDSTGLSSVPAPSLAVAQSVFHRLVGHDAAADCVNAHLKYGLHESVHVVAVEQRVESAHTPYVAREGTVFDDTGMVERCPETVGASQTVDGSDGREHLHCRCRPHGLPLVVAEYGTVCRKVVNHDSYLRRVEHPVAQHVRNLCLYILRPWQYGVGRSGVCGCGAEERVFALSD